MATTPGLVRVALAGDPPAQAERGVVSAQHPAAAVAGVEVLAAGGNVVDAAVATGFANAVADVGRTGIGGYGGHLVYHEAATRQTWLVDFPSRAPLAAHDRMFTPVDPSAASGVDSGGWWPTAGNANQTGPLAVGVPAIVAGLAAAHARFGTLPWADVLAPAIRLAQDGIEFGPSGRDPVLDERRRAAAFPETQRVFMDAWQGDRLQQPDLAHSLRRLAEHPNDLYLGELADQIIEYLASIGGKLDRADLASYQPAITQAHRSRYRNHLVLAPGPTSGGGVFLPLLAALERFDLPAMDPLGADRMVLLADTTGSAWPQRFVRDQGTSHFSVADTQGNVVACTTTLQVLLGSAVTVPGTGIVLNNAMGLFDPRPRQPNSIAPGKRAITNMCPTIVLRTDGRPRLSSGASGGRRIPSMLVQACTLAIDHGWSMPDALRAPRYHTEGDHHLLLEQGLDESTLRTLTEHGYHIDLKPENGTALGGQAPAIWYDDDGQLFGAPDPRRHGGAAAV